MTALQETMESPCGLAGQSLGAAPLFASFGSGDSRRTEEELMTDAEMESIDVEWLFAGYRSAWDMIVARREAHTAKGEARPHEQPKDKDYE